MNFFTIFQAPVWPLLPPQAATSLKESGMMMDDVSRIQSIPLVPPNAVGTLQKVPVTPADSVGSIEATPLVPAQTVGSIEAVPLVPADGKERTEDLPLLSADVYKVLLNLFFGPAADLTLIPANAMSASEDLLLGAIPDIQSEAKCKIDVMPSEPMYSKRIMGAITSHTIDSEKNKEIALASVPFDEAKLEAFPSVPFVGKGKLEDLPSVPFVGKTNLEALPSAPFVGKDKLEALPSDPWVGKGKLEALPSVPFGDEGKLEALPSFVGEGKLEALSSVPFVGEGKLEVLPSFVGKGKLEVLPSFVGKGKLEVLPSVPFVDLEKFEAMPSVTSLEMRKAEALTFFLSSEKEIQKIRDHVKVNKGSLPSDLGIVWNELYRVALTASRAKVDFSNMAKEKLEILSLLSDELEDF